jgi:hypothetical protein
MPEHVTDLLGAYLDKELRGTSLHRVQNHIEQCEQCRAKLDEMQELSALLRESPAQDFLPTERFIANLTLKLPRQTTPRQTRKTADLGWWLIPIGVIGAWLFVQLTLTLTSWVMIATDLGLLGDSLAWFNIGNATRQATWFNLLVNLVGSPAENLSFLNRVDLFLQDFSKHYIWQTALGLLYLTWLARWWLAHKKQDHNFSLS